MMPLITQTHAALTARIRSESNLQQIGNAMQSHHDAHGCFPPAASHNAQGEPLLSWRVQILPFLGKEAKRLHGEFHLDEPWDSEHNRKLIEQMPDVFRSPAAQGKEKGLTTYLAVVGEETVFCGREGVKIADIPDGCLRTILVVEVPEDDAVIWTKPQDLPFDPDRLAQDLAGPFPGGFHALFCENRVRFLKLPIEPEKLRALLTRAGGESISLGQLYR